MYQDPVLFFEAHFSHFVRKRSTGPLSATCQGVVSSGAGREAYDVIEIDLYLVLMPGESRIAAVAVRGGLRQPRWLWP
jgi:hypothetical protein